VRQPTAQWTQGPAVPVVSVLVALVIGGIFVAISGHNPLVAYQALVLGAFGSPYDITETLVIAVPLTLAGLSVAVAFRTGLFNIGAQGQLLVGAVAAGAVGAALAPLPGVLLLPLTLAAGVTGGAAYGAIAG